jgi:hypothetical protein
MIQKTKGITSENNLLFVYCTCFYDRYVDSQVSYALSRYKRDCPPLHWRPDAEHCAYFKRRFNRQGYVLFFFFGMQN